MSTEQEQDESEAREVKNKATVPGRRIEAWNGSKLTKRKPYTSTWHTDAYNLLKCYQSIAPCGECGHPVVEGYCCGTCGTGTP